jgi:hypothetical protein
MLPDAWGEFSSQEIESRKHPQVLVILPKLKVAGSIPVARSKRNPFIP